MKARNPTLAGRAMRRPHSPFPRPRTVVAIIRDKEERIDVASFRGIRDHNRVPGLPKGLASYYDTPQSVRLTILRNYIDELARQWAAYEADLDPYVTVLMADALKEIESKETSETNKQNASRPRNPVTKAELVAFLDQYERDAGTKRGGSAAACRKFLIDPGTLKKRLVD
jgi:hypothetical protein